jgi:hypothetical protein
MSKTIELKKFIQEMAREQGEPFHQEYLDVLTRKNVPQTSKYDVPRKHYVSQMDLGVFPQGDENKFLLYIIDVASRYIRAVPIKDKKAKTVADALKKILDEGFQTKIIYCDSGSEFKNETMKNMLDAKGISIRFTVVGRHNQLAVVDSYIYMFHKVIVSLNSYHEMKQMQEGRRWERNANYNWSRYVKPTQDFINQFTRKDVPISKLKGMKLPIIPKGYKFLKIGQKVRIPLEAPYDPVYQQRENPRRFRVGDYRYDPTKTYKVAFISVRGNQPIRYLVEDTNGRFIGNVSYQKEELLPVN